MHGPSFPFPLPSGYHAASGERNVFVVKTDEAEAVRASGLGTSRFPLAGVEPVSLGGRGGLFRIPLAHGHALVRPALHGGLLRFATRDRFLDRFRTVRELVLTAELRGEGIAAPEPVAAAAVKVGPFWRLFYASRHARGEDLHAFFARPSPADRRAQVLRKAGALIRRLHERGIVHADLHPKNLFVEEGSGDVLVLDLDQTDRSAPPSPRERRRNLVRFYRFGKRREGLGEGPAWTEAELRALLDGYAGDDAAPLLEAVLRSYRRGSWAHRIGWWLERAFASR